MMNGSSISFCTSKLTEVKFKKKQQIVLLLTEFIYPTVLVSVSKLQCAQRLKLFVIGVLILSI